MKTLIRKQITVPRWIRTINNGFEPSTFRLTAERANRLRHGDRPEGTFKLFIKVFG